jgi:hypothetical protein
VLLAACHASSPTAPTVVPAPPVVSTPPPVVSTPPPVTNPLLTDPRFDRAFYRQFALGALEGGPYALRRLASAPRIYLRTIDDAGRAVDPGTLAQTASALIDTAGQLTGVFGLAGLEQGTETRQGHPGWITVRWAAEAGPFCGVGHYAGDLITLYPRTAGCRCDGGPAVALGTVRHELGHVLGFYHTDNRADLMYHQMACHARPSEREIFHARVVYSMPIGSLDP